MDWNCKTVDVYTHEQDGHEEVIWNVHWRVSKEDGDYKGSSYGTQSLNTEDIQDFKPFDEVTSAMIEGWVKDSMGEEAVTALEASLDSQIEDEKNPTSVTKTIEN